MTEDNDSDESIDSGIDRRSVLKSMGAAGAASIVGVPAMSGSAAASSHTATVTVVSDTSTTVTRRRAGTGENEPDCSFTEIDVPAVPTYEVNAWSETTGCFDDSDADWIWYSTEEKKVSDSDDEYYVLNNEYGDVVEFERTFNIDGTPVSDGTLTIAVDNGFEAYVNGTMVASRAVEDGEDIDWECSDLDVPYVDTDGWRTDGNCDNIAFTVPEGALNQGENTLTVLGVNAQNRDGDGDIPDGRNPGGLIYKLDVEYEACEKCESEDDLLAKYEWDDDAGEFVLEGDGDEHIELSSVSLDEDDEPTEACFSTEYCDVDAVVKAGTEYETYSDASGEVCVTGIETENPEGESVTYAISNVRFYCEAPEDESVGNSDREGGSSDGGGDENGQGNDENNSEDNDKGHGNNEGDDEDNPGNDDGENDGNSGHGDDSSGGSSNGGGRGKGR